jgi:hypothetical protein
MVAGAFVGAEEIDGAGNHLKSTGPSRAQGLSKAESEKNKVKRTE